MQKAEQHLQLPIERASHLHVIVLILKFAADAVNGDIYSKCHFQRCDL